MMNACNKCYKVSGVIFLLLGLAYLAVDLNWWDFWNIQWWTALFLVWGIGSVASSTCKDCQALRKPMKGK